MSSPCLGQGCQGGFQGGPGGGGVWPLEIEESILETVGGHLVGVDSLAGLRNCLLLEVCQHLSQCRCLQVVKYFETEGSEYFVVVKMKYFWFPQTLTFSI